MCLEHVRGRECERKEPHDPDDDEHGDDAARNGMLSHERSSRRSAKTCRAGCAVADPIFEATRARAYVTSNMDEGARQADRHGVPICGSRGVEYRPWGWTEKMRRSRSTR